MGLGFLKKLEIPDEIPKEVKKVAAKLNSSKSKIGCLQKAMDYFGANFSSCYIFVNFFDLWRHDLERLWHIKEQHCVNLNFMMRVLLVNTNFFSDEDFKIKITRLWLFSPHQYLRVRVGKDKWLNLDPSGIGRGYKLGEYMHGFCRFSKIKKV